MLKKKILSLSTLYLAPGILNQSIQIVVLNYHYLTVNEHYVIKCYNIHIVQTPKITLVNKYTNNNAAYYIITYNLLTRNFKQMNQE